MELAEARQISAQSCSSRIWFAAAYRPDFSKQYGTVLVQMA
jgi:hypothetical protein